MNDLNKLQNMDHQEKTNALQRPEDQQYDRDQHARDQNQTSGLGSNDDNADDGSGSSERLFEES